LKRLASASLYPPFFPSCLLESRPSKKIT